MVGIPSYTMVNHGKPWYNCSVTNETFVAELFLTNGVSVNFLDSDDSYR